LASTLSSVEAFQRTLAAHRRAMETVWAGEKGAHASAPLGEPMPVQQLQRLCGIRTAKVCSALAELAAQGQVIRDARGYQLKLPLPVSRTIDPKGNGNGKHSDSVQ